MYFCFRLFVEWHLLAPDVRNKLLYAVDLYVALGIASISFTTFIAVGLEVSWQSVQFIPAVTYIASLVLVVLMLFVFFPLLLSAYRLASSWISPRVAISQRVARPVSLVVRYIAAFVGFLAAITTIYGRLWEPLIERDTRERTDEVQYLLSELESSIIIDEEPPTRVGGIYQQLRERLAVIDTDTTEHIDILDRIREVASDSPTLMARMAEDPDASIRAIAAGSQNAPADLLAQLLADPDPIVRIAHRETPVDVLARLAKNSDTSVRANVASNLSTPLSVLAGLARDEDGTVRRSVALNRNASVDILTSLAGDRDVWVRDPVAFHPTTPAHILERLAGDPSTVVRRRVARRADTPQAVLERLATDSERFVRNDLAYNRSAPAAALVQLAQDDFSGTRRGVAFNPNTPSDILNQLTADPDDLVRVPATQNLERRLAE
jgi:hypothetical protein